MIKYPTLHSTRRLRESLRLSANTISTDLALRTSIENVYIKHLKEMYTNSSMTVHLLKESNKPNTSRGVKMMIYMVIHLTACVPFLNFKIQLATISVYCIHK